MVYYTRSERLTVTNTLAYWAHLNVKKLSIVNTYPSFHQFFMVRLYLKKISAKLIETVPMAQLTLLALATLHDATQIRISSV